MSDQDTVSWEYEEKKAMIGDCNALIRMGRDGKWNFHVQHIHSKIAVTGDVGLSSRAEELAINAAKWLNAGMPATER